MLGIKAVETTHIRDSRVSDGEGLMTSGQMISRRSITSAAQYFLLL